MTRSETFSEAVRKTVYIYKKLIPKQGWTDDSAELKYLRRYFLYLNIICKGAVFNRGPQQQLQSATSLLLKGLQQQLQSATSLLLKGFQQQLQCASTLLSKRPPTATVVCKYEKVS